MISSSWLKKRRTHWAELDGLVKRAIESGLNSLDASELQKLALLYRQAAADLSALRKDPSGGSYTAYLARLLSQAHNVVYAGQRINRTAILSFFTHTYPEIFCRNLRHVMMAFVLFVAAGLVGTVVTLNDPDFAREVLGPQMIRTIERREMWTHSIVSVQPQAASRIMTNNISVSFLAFSSGIVGGLGTLYLVFFNGLMMGVVGTACFLHQMSLQLWSFIAAHGALELPAIFIAAGAGFRLAQGLLFPGYLNRRDSIVQAGTESVQLLMGIIPMLIAAGLIESFISPSGAPLYVKFGLCIVLLLLQVTYFSSPYFRKRSLQ